MLFRSGLGPAGYTLAHYLLNEGFGVVGIDGLKIEPLPKEWTGDLGRTCPKPIKNISEITDDLDDYDHMPGPEGALVALKQA